MNDTLRVLYDYILSDLIREYCKRTDFAERERAWEQRYALLRDQLSGDQQVLLEEIDEASNFRQAAELEAMFLASLDLYKSLRLL